MPTDVNEIIFTATLKGFDRFEIRGKNDFDKLTLTFEDDRGNTIKGKLSVDAGKYNWLDKSVGQTFEVRNGFFGGYKGKKGQVFELSLRISGVQRAKQDLVIGRSAGFLATVTGKVAKSKPGWALVNAEYANPKAKRAEDKWKTRPVRVRVPNETELAEGSSIFAQGTAKTQDNGDVYLDARFASVQSPQ